LSVAVVDGVDEEGSSKGEECPVTTINDTIVRDSKKGERSIDPFLLMRIC